MLLKARQRSPDAFVKEAQQLQEEVPLRLANRLVDFHRLPFLAMRCEPLAEVCAIYLEDFMTLSALPKVTDGKGVLMFKEELEKSQRRRMWVVRDTRRAIRELTQFPDVKADLQTFLDKLFVTRIGRLLLEDHFIKFVDHALSNADPNCLPQSDGIVTETKLADLLHSVAADINQLSDELYGQSVNVNIVDSGCATVHSIPRYLRFIFQEILKNAVKATMEKHPANPPTVQVVIITGTYDVQIKISDTGGGMPRSVLKHIWRYGYSGFQLTHQSSSQTLSGIMGGSTDVQAEMSGFGVGLPLSRLYARYLGGDIQISQVLGHGTEVSVVLSQHGKREEFDVGESEDYHGSDVWDDCGGRSSLMAPV